jgi:nitrogen fixation NifU-like protein
MSEEQDVNPPSDASDHPAVESDLLENAIANPRNLGEMEDADAVGTVGSPDCGDMVRMWIKFAEKDGKKIIDKASFQSFGCQTAIAVASVATELIAGKTIEEALALSPDDLSRPLGPLPPMKIHCGQLVESALARALKGDTEGASKESMDPRISEPGEIGPTLADSMQAGSGSKGKIRIIKLDSAEEGDE